MPAPPRLRPRTALGLILLSVALFLFSGDRMRRASQPTAAGGSAVKQGGLEFAGTAARATRLLDGWGPEARARMRKVVAWDFAFIPAYVVLLFTLCAYVASRQIAPNVGAFLAYGQIVAGLLDAVENVGLLRLLAQPAPRIWAPIAAGCAALKWLLVLAALVYLLAAGVSWLACRAHSP
jgi:hypothetical protein